METIFERTMDGERCALNMNKKLKLLLLEDDESDAELIRYALKKAGLHFEARQTDSRAGFLKALAEFEPDLILADYSLPGFTALDALKLLKTRPKADVPLILVTGSHSEEVAVG